MFGEAGESVKLWFKVILDILYEDLIVLLRVAFVFFMRVLAFGTRSRIGFRENLMENPSAFGKIVKGDCRFSRVGCGEALRLLQHSEFPRQRQHRFLCFGCFVHLVLQLLID